MNDLSPTPTKHPTLTMTSNAREQVKQHSITKAAVFDVMKNSTKRTQLDNGQIRFSGSERYPNTVIIAGFLPKKRQWVITNLQVLENTPAQKLEPPPPPAPAVPPPVVRDRPTSLSAPEVIFTNHAKKVLKKSFLDSRVIEQVIQNPVKKQDANEGKTRFLGWHEEHQLHVIAKFLPKERSWLVITVELHDPITAIAHFDGQATDDHPAIAFTIHAQERMQLRNIFPMEVQDAIFFPEETFEDDEEKVKFIGREQSHNRAIHVVGRFLPDENKWLVISVWVRGEEDDGTLSTWKPKPKQIPSGKPGIAYTNHARDRMPEVGVDENTVEVVITTPQQKINEDEGKVKFVGAPLFNGNTVNVRAKFLPDENKWLVISVWVHRVGGQSPSPQKQNRQPFTGRVPRVALTNHVREWMSRENVSQSRIEGVIQSPYKQQPQGDGKVKFSTYASKDGESLHVVARYLADENKWLVITAWFVKTRTQSSRTARENTGAWAYVVLLLALVLIIGAVGYLLFQASGNGF